MAVVSGSKLAVSGMPTVARWQVTALKQTVPVVTSGTQRGILRACGFTDWTGRIDCLGWPSKTPGTKFTFIGSIDGTNGATGDAYVEEVQVIGDYESNSPIMTVYQLTGDGELTFGAAAATDASLPTVVCTAATTVTGVTGDVAAWAGIVRCRGIPYASSQTAGARKKEPGAIDARAVIDLYLGSTVPDVGDTTDIVLGGTDGVSITGAVVTRVEEYGPDSTVIINGRELSRFRVHYEHSASSTSNLVKIGGVTIWPPSGS